MTADTAGAASGRRAVACVVLGRCAHESCRGRPRLHSPCLARRPLWVQHHDCGKWAARHDCCGGARGCGARTMLCDAPTAHRRLVPPLRYRPPQVARISISVRRRACRDFANRARARRCCHWHRRRVVLQPGVLRRLGTAPVTHPTFAPQEVRMNVRFNRCIFNHAYSAERPATDKQVRARRGWRGQQGRRGARVRACLRSRARRRRRARAIAIALSTNLPRLTASVSAADVRVSCVCTRDAPRRCLRSTSCAADAPLATCNRFADDPLAACNCPPSPPTHTHTHTRARRTQVPFHPGQAER